MDWLKGLVKSTSNTRKPARRNSSGKKSAEKRYYVKHSDKRIVTAYKNPNGPGYVYHKRNANGVRNVPVNGNTYKTEQEAKAKLERLKKAGKKG